MRIKDARMLRIPAQRRPHYPPTERLAILELRAARAWSMAQTARRMLVTTATVASWMGRLDEEGPRALVQTREPVNKFPDFVAYIVRRLKVLCPTMGKEPRSPRSFAESGLHLGSTTVQRAFSTDRSRPEPAPVVESICSGRDSERNPIMSGIVISVPCPDFPRLLDLVVPVVAAAVLAVLLVDRRGR